MIHDKPPLDEALLVHFGIKGMKWGHRKKPDIKQRTETKSVTLKNGEKLTLNGDKTPAIAKVLARLSPSLREKVNNSSSFTIQDAKGDTVGQMSLYKESPKSMNIVWVGIKDDQRGKGYATASMVAAIDVAKKQKLDSVTLEVPGNAPDARHIYERLGFKAGRSLSTPEDDPVWGGLTEMHLDLTKEGR